MKRRIGAGSWTGLLGALLLTGCQEADAPPAPEAPREAPAPPEPPPRSVLRAPTPPAAPAPAPAIAPVQETVYFGEGAYELDDKARERLDAVLAAPALQAGGPIVLRGHSDSGGADRANRKAARLRAEAVAEYLQDQGVPDDRITVFALGEGAPAAPNVRPDGTDDPEGRALNRRVEISVAPPAKPEEAAPTPAA